MSSPHVARRRRCCTGSGVGSRPAARLAVAAVLLGVFVYGFLGWNLRVSFSDWRGPAADRTTTSGCENYAELSDDKRFTDDVQNVVVFTLVFVVGTLVARLLPGAAAREGRAGRGLLPRRLPVPDGDLVHRHRDRLALAAQQRRRAVGDRPQQAVRQRRASASSPTTGFKSDSQLGDRRDRAAGRLGAVRLRHGALPRRHARRPDDLREAARVDGANEPKVFWYVVRPMLLPVLMSAVVILAHISLKTFDLCLRDGRREPRIETPALYMWFTTLRRPNFSPAARRSPRCWCFGIAARHRPVHLVLDTLGASHMSTQVD